MTRKNIIITLLMAVVSLAIIVYFYPHQSARRYVYEQGKPWNYAKLIAPLILSSTLTRLPYEPRATVYELALCRWLVVPMKSKPIR